MSKYISIPLTEEQLDLLYEYREFIRKFSSKFWLAGSFPLHLFLGDKVKVHNDVDIFVNSDLSPPELFHTYLTKDNTFRYKKLSSFAVTVSDTKGLFDIQLIPVSCDNLEDLLDTFDLTSSAIGISIEDDGIFFKVHVDLFRFLCGLNSQFAMRESRHGNVALIQRAIKYADKFKHDVEYMFPQFAEYLSYADSRLVSDYQNDKEVFIKKFVEIKGALSENYEDNELLAQYFNDSGVTHDFGYTEAFARVTADNVILGTATATARNTWGDF